MSEFLKLRLTDIGKKAFMSNQDGAIGFRIASIGLSGDALNMSNAQGINYLGNMLKMQNIPLNSSIVKDNSLQINVEINSSELLEVRSMGVYNDAGVLIAVTGVAEGLLFKVYPNIPLFQVLILVFEGEEKSTYEINPNINTNITKALLSQHLAANNPHPLYLQRVQADALHEDLKTFVNQYLHVGCWLGTDNKAFNPTTLLFSMFGIRSVWELRRHIPKGVSQELETKILNAEGVISNGVYSVKTTYIWNRMPDDYVAPIAEFTLTANKVQVKEGENITFTLQTSNVDPGTTIPWIITGVSLDDISPQALSGLFVVDNQGRATHTLDVVLDQLSEAGETLKIRLADHPDTYATVLIKDSSQNVMSSRVYRVGTYSIKVPPGHHLIVDMYAGGGSCGFPNNNALGGNPQRDGVEGAHVTFSRLNSVAKAGGGAKGMGGRHGVYSGKYFIRPNETQGADGGVTSVQDSDGLYRVLVAQNGNASLAYELLVPSYIYTLPDGGAALAGALPNSNRGGNAIEQTGNSVNLRRLFGGGAGGGGSRLKIQVDPQSVEMTYTLIVGETAIYPGGKGGLHDGGFAYAVVEIN